MKPMINYQVQRPLRCCVLEISLGQTCSNYRVSTIQTQTMKFQTAGTAFLAVTYSKPDISPLVVHKWSFQDSHH